MLDRADIEQVVAGVAFLVSSEGMEPVQGQEVEARLGSIVDVSPALGPTGPGLTIRIPKKRIAVTMAGEKWEFAYSGGEFPDGLPADLSQVILTMASFLQKPTWKKMGYNFNFIFRAPGGDGAVESIARSVVNAEELSRRLGFHVWGAASWLYMDVEEWTFTLRLEPRASDKTSRFVWAYGNFDQELPDGLPSETTIRSNIQRLHDTFADTLEKM
jgi:hypothetical protein